jgi:hypothetical protein
MKWRFLAVDIDGTMVGPDSRVSRELGEAIRDARRAGLHVSLATGRCHGTSVDVWRQLDLPDPHEPMIVLSGAKICHPRDGRTLHCQAMDRRVACALADALGEQGHSAVAIVDGWGRDTEYYAAESDDIEDVRRRWLSRLGRPIRSAGRLSDHADLPPVLRMTALVPPERGDALERLLRQRFAETIELHTILAPNFGIIVVEAFAPGVSKWSAIRHLCDGLGIESVDVAAIGDDVNDLPMVRAAGLGATFHKAPDVLRQAADVILPDESLATFIEDLVDGRYDALDAVAARDE